LSYVCTRYFNTIDKDSGTAKDTRTMSSDDRECPIPKDELLDMVREEAKRRNSDEFQAKVAKEEATGDTDGTVSIVQLQVWKNIYYKYTYNFMFYF